MTEIFLSYSSVDRERVRPIHRELASKYKVFWDQETPLGENWDQWIKARIVEARVVVVFWTKSSGASVNVQHEARIAQKYNKLIPALLEVMDIEDFPMGFYVTQAAALYDRSDPARHRSYSALVEAVRQRFAADTATIEAAVRQETANDIADLARRANPGDAAAQAELGYRYAAGIGVSKDDEKSTYFSQLAAIQGNARGQHNLGVTYEWGIGGLEKNEREAARLFRLSAAQNFAGAQFRLAAMYERGRGGLPKDQAEAARLYKLAAGQGFAPAQCNLGLLCQFGLGGLSKDEAEALRLYRLAADQGDAAAQIALAYMLERGLGGAARNETEATRLHQLAAAQGGNVKKALRAYDVAAAQGDEKAGEILKRLRR